jgi:AraC-like DNA-binding protein
LARHDADIFLKVERRRLSLQHSAMHTGKPDGAAWVVAILRLIETHSGDTGLNAIKVAGLLGVTPRYVHLLLRPTGKSFTRHLLETRLQKAAALLRDPHWHERRIADVAAEAGFSDLSYFSRAFRRRFGATPSQAREAQRRGG